MSKPSSAEDIENLQKSQEAAAAAQQMMDQNAKYGPQAPGAGSAANGGSNAMLDDETTLGMLRRKYGINPNVNVGMFQ